MGDERDAVKRWRAGQRAAERAARELQAREGARPERAVAESLAAVNALEAAGQWPSPRDPASERAVQKVRARWALVERRARRSRTR